MIPARKADSSALIRVLGQLMLAGVYGSTGCLMAGLGLWLFDHDSAAGNLLLTIGLFSLMATPGLRMLVSALEAIRAKDWLHLASILTVAALLALAVTLAARG